jgi:hypothetical protein
MVMTELRAETVRTIDANQEGLDRSLRSIEGRLKAAEEKLEGVLFWSRIVFYFLFGVMFLFSMFSFSRSGSASFG